MSALDTGADVKLQECGCSVGECSHGAGAAAGTHGGIGELRRQIEQNAQDQEDALPHYGKFVSWWEGIDADMQRLMSDTHQSDVQQLGSIFAEQIQEIKRLETALHQSVEETRAVAERL